MNLIDFSCFYFSPIPTLPFKFSFVLPKNHYYSMSFFDYDIWTDVVFKNLSKYTRKQMGMGMGNQTLLVVLFVSQSFWSLFLFVYHKFHFRPNTFLEFSLGFRLGCFSTLQLIGLSRTRLALGTTLRRLQTRWETFG